MEQQNSGLDFDLGKTLRWCADNEVSFSITNHDGVMAVTSRRENIFAEYIVDEPYDANNLGRATWASIFAVMSGTNFHAQYGHYPPVSSASGTSDPTSGVGGSEPQNGSGPVNNDVPPTTHNAAPDLHPDRVPRRH